jgi:branched-chain amino acid transport system permease protein
MVEVSSSALMQGLVNGIILACIYILLALGLTLILSIMNIMQFAHGEIYMIGAFIVYYLIVLYGFNFFLAVPISMVVVGILGLFLERLFFRPLKGKFLESVCAAVALMLILQTSVVLGLGSEERHIPNFWPGVFNIMDWVVPKDRLVAVFFSVGLTSALFLFLKRHKFGQAIIATAQNWDGALLQGVNPNLMSALVMGIGSALAAVAGALAGGIFLLGPFMGSTALIKGITIIVLGGMGSLLGVIVAGIILGLCDSLIAIVFGPAPAVIVPLILVIVVLIAKPRGLFGLA